MSERRRLHLRLAFRIYLVALVTLVVIVTVVVTGFLRTDWPPPLLRNVGYVLETVSAVGSDETQLRAELQRVRGTSGMEVALFAPGGRLLATSFKGPTPQPLDEPRVLGLGSDGLRLSDRLRAMPFCPKGGSGPRGHAIVSLLRGPGGPPGRPGGPFGGPPGMFPLGTVVFTVSVILGCMGLAAFAVSRMIGRPLGTIARAARRFGAGDLSARSSLTRPDELGDLGRTFDDMADQLTRLLASQRELLASVSHELRTPLSRIRVALDLAAEGDAQAARTSLKDISQDLTELEALVSDVLAMARLDAPNTGPEGLPRLHIEPVDLREIVARAVARFESTAPGRVVVVEVAGPGASNLSVEADPGLLRRVIENLLSNAHKYSAATETIHVHAQSRADRGVIAVVDKGQGIAAADLPRVFDPFFRADPSRDRGTGGTGLGLALARRIVAAHGGQIRIESQLGLGTRVEFDLPLL